MKLKDIMSQTVIKIHPHESVAVAARLLANHNIGVLPVCDQNGELRGVVTDRDLVTRCIASNRAPEETKVQDVMTGRIVTATPNMDVAVAAYLMGREQVRRLPVIENGKLLLQIQTYLFYDACPPNVLRLSSVQGHDPSANSKAVSQHSP